MPESHLTSLELVNVPQHVVQQTLGTLQAFGKMGLEGLVLWLGRIERSRATVIEGFVPKQRSVSSDEGLGYFVDGETLFEINRDLAERGLLLIAQVHSHPAEAYHSEADDTYAIVTADGGLSLVVPHFGVAPADPSRWAVYRLHIQNWTELSFAEKAQLFRIVEDL